MEKDKKSFCMESFIKDGKFDCSKIRTFMKEKDFDCGQMKSFMKNFFDKSSSPGSSSCDPEDGGSCCM